jgi:hypothetical protein
LDADREYGQLQEIERKHKARDNRRADEEDVAPFDLAILRVPHPPRADKHRYSFSLFY